jgi:hypothetical protein
VAPGVTTSAITRNAPTVCIAATVEAASSVKNTILQQVVRMPMVARMALVEEHQHQILPDQRQHRQRDRADDDQLQRVVWRDRQHMLPSTMVCTLTGVGEIDTMNSPSAKNE